MSRLWNRCLLGAFLVGALVAPLGAQESRGGLRGLVLDSARAEPVAGALVRIQGAAPFRISDSQGRFSFPDLPVGTVQVVATAPGFRSSGPVTGTIQVNSYTSVEIRLRRESFQLPALVVTAARGAEGYGESVSGVDIVTSDDIRRRSPVTAAGALRFASGVVFNDRQIDIRGSSGMARGVGSRVLLMVDGHRFLSGTTGEVAFEALPIVGIERIEVVKGPGSTLYGSNALGGVVNLIRDPIPQAPETLVRAHMGIYDSPDEFSFTDNSLNYQGLDLRHARQVGRVGFFGEAGLKSSDGFRQNGEYDRTFLHGGFSIFRDEGHPLLEMFGLWSQQTRGEFFQWAEEDRPLEVAPEELGDQIDSEKTHLGATYTPIVTDVVFLQLRGGLYRDDTKNRFHDNQDYHRSSRYSLDAQASLHQLKGHVVTVGLEAAYTPVESDILGQPTVVDFAVFAQEDYRLGRTFRAVAGLRGDYHDTNEGESEFTVNPKVGLVYTPSHRIRLRSSLSKGYRAPSVTEQFVSSSQFGFRVVPNLALRGESAWALEVAAAGNATEWAFLEAALFQTNFQDLIGPAPVPGGEFGVFQFQNVAEARVRGLDSSVEIGFPDYLLQGKLNYLFLNSEDERTGQSLPYRSTHNLTVSGDAGPLGMDFQYRSRVEEVLAYPLDDRGNIVIVGLRLGFRLAGVSGQLKLDNLFQERYVNVQERTPGASRSLQLMLQSTF